MSGKLVHPAKYLTLMERAERSQWNRLSVVSFLIPLTSIGNLSSQLILQRNCYRTQDGFVPSAKTIPAVGITATSLAPTTSSWTCLPISSLISYFPKVHNNPQTMTKKIHQVSMFISMEDVLSCQKIYSF